MEVIQYIIHIEEHLPTIVNNFGPYIYGVIFFIIFAETGFVVTPFLPGDSLLFVVGSLAGSGYLDLWLVYFLMLIAAIAGNTLNYYLGQKFGPRAFSRENSKLFNKAYLEKTRIFFEKHGGKTIILTRFLPIIRSFAPFVAGMGNMNYKTFQFYNVVGGFLWITSLTFAGYFFGSLPIVKDNFEFIVIGVIVVSVAPAIFEFLKHKQTERAEARLAKEASYKDLKETFKKEHLEE